MENVTLNIKQRDVSYLKLETLTYAELETMTYAEIQEKYYMKPTPKTVTINLIEPIRELKL